MNRPSTSSARILPVTPRGQKTRQKLLRAAETIFGEKGYEAAAIADITRKADVALGTFYVYFPDKQSIFVEVVDELGERLRRLIAEAVTGVEGRLQIERKGFETFLKYAAAHRGIYRIVRQAEFVDADAFTRYYRTIADGYTKGLAAAMKRGEIRKADAECLAYCLMGIGDFLGMRWVLWESEAELNRVLETAIGFIERGLRNDRPVPKLVKRGRSR